MDGENNFISGGRSDDDGGTPVQDEHPASDSAGRQSEDQRVCVSAAKRKKFLSDSEDEEEDEEKPVVKKSRVMSDDDNDSNGSNSKSGYEDEQLIQDIFGASEDEDEEDFMGFDKEHLEGDKQTKEKTAPQEEESNSGEGVDHSGQHFISDFDIMLARRKAMKSRCCVRGISISDADNVVSAMIAKMTEAAEEDRTLNIQNKLATKKLLLLPQVVKHLKKQDLKETFLDCGVMSAIKEWISPLPDKSLPILNIREEMLKILQQLPSVSQQTLEHSGIGRAVMFLYKHPKETRYNKELALKLIHEWSRPIFGVTSNIREMTREERQQRDLDQQMPQRRCLSSGGQTPRRDFEKQLTGEEKALSPGYPVVCNRARVPMPSNKVYVVRPKWNVASNRVPKNGMVRLDKLVHRLATIRRQAVSCHAVKVSINGNWL